MKVKSDYRSTFIACCLGYITQAVVVNLAPLLFIVFQMVVHWFMAKKKGEKAAPMLIMDALQLPGVLSQGVSSLSGGMKRRVALCRALMYDADFLVLDEPFKGLDAETKKAVMDVLKAKSAGKTVLLVTHDEDEARYLGASVMKL